MSWLNLGNNYKTYHHDMVEVRSHFRLRAQTTHDSDMSPTCQKFWNDLSLTCRLLITDMLEYQICR
jgi:hypothetical protein